MDMYFERKIRPKLASKKLSDTTLTENSTTRSPLHAVTPATGTIGVVTDSTLTGNGTTGNPLHVVTPTSGTMAVVTDGLTITRNGLTASSLKIPSYKTICDLSILFAQSVPTSTITKLQNTTYNSSFNNITNLNYAPSTGIWTTTLDGMHHFDVSITWAVNSTGFCRIQTYLSNTFASDFNINSNYSSGVGTIPTTNHVSGDIYMNVGDTLFWNVTQKSGAALNATFVLMTVTYTGHN